MTAHSRISRYCQLLALVVWEKQHLQTRSINILKGFIQCHAFVSVSQKPDLKRIIKDMISQVPCEEHFREDIHTWDVMKCITKQRELLEDKRYLIVIDDIWSIQAWNSIKCAFPENSHSSRIMTTTRKIDIATFCCPSGNDRKYEMEALSDVYSKRLFFKRIFGTEDGCPSILIIKWNTEKMWSRPLAINSLSSLLASKPIIKDVWEKVKRSIGSALDKIDNLQGMGSILSLSYNDLPPYLRTCLPYLCVFPEDFKIRRENLLMQWTAEGFISEEHGWSRQEVAESYFYELINRNMVQPLGIGIDGKVHGCRVHDMMLELIISKSAEDNFVTVIGGGQTILAPNHGSIRRLSVQNIDQELASILTKEDLSHVLSLTVTALSCVKHLPSLVEFESLRVLDFRLCRSVEKYDMKDIGKPYQLKYLCLGFNISYTPSGIVMLHNLERLDLRSTRIRVLPAQIIQLINLQCLLLPQILQLRFCKNEKRKTLLRIGWFIKIPDGMEI